MTGIVMRKLILIAAMSLLATQVHAGGSRSLSLAASSASQQAEQPATTAPASQPTNVQTATTAPTSTATSVPATSTAPATAAPAATTTARSAASPGAATTEAIKPKRRQPSTEARVIRELHRHGIYW